jgi:hypothetical protein
MVEINARIKKLERESKQNYKKLEENFDKNREEQQR